MGFSASCAFVGLHLLSSSAMDETLLLGSAQLLGLLIERAQRKRDGLEEKLKSAELEVREMRRLRSEDAKANDRVVGIFASHEQNWIAEKKRLKHNIRALVNELQSTKARNEEAAAELSRRAEEEAECATRLKEELEEKLRRAEELREKAKEEAHSTFTDLVSSQRNLEAEIGRALRQAEEAKRQALEVFEKKEEAVSLAEKLSDEIAITKNEMEQKDKVLSAMLRKSKLDSAEKEALHKEVKVAKAKRKQAELETERWRSKWESRHKKGPKSLPEAGGSEPRANFRSKSSDHGNNSSRTLLHEYLGAEWKKERKSLEPKEENAIATVKPLDRYSSANGREDLVTADIEHLQNWVHLEVDKQTSVLERRHYKEVEAFVDEMRLKDEKLAAAHWRILSKEVEAMRLRSRVEEVTAGLSKMSANSSKLEDILLDKEEEIKSLKERFGVFVHQSLKSSNSSPDSSSSAARQASWPETRLREIKSRERDQDAKIIQARNSYDADQIDNSIVHDIVTISPADSADAAAAAATQLLRINEICIEEVESSEASAGEKEESVALVTPYPRNEIEEEDDGVMMDTGHAHARSTSHKDAADVIRLPADPKPFMKRDSSGKMDIHALGVDHKIKRLKQQLLVLDKLVGKIHNASAGYVDSGGRDDNKRRSEEFELVMSLLNSQVKRFQTLEEKTDDLCRRMNTSSRASGRRGGSLSGKTKEQRKMLQSFLEEAFQLQRYMVATGQKLIDMQSKISWSFGIIRGLEESAGFSIEQFADVIRTLFRDIQRGSELRIARIIGDVEGTLACSWILSHVK